MRATRSRESNRVDEAPRRPPTSLHHPFGGRIPNVGSSSNSGMRASRRLAPLSEASQTNQGITDSTDQTNSTDRSLTQTPPLPHEPGRILFNDLGMLEALEGLRNAMGVPSSKTSSGLVGHGARQTARPVGQKAFRNSAMNPKSNASAPVGLCCLNVNGESATTPGQKNHHSSLTASQSVRAGAHRVE